MRQIPKTAAPHQRVRYGFYVERQLRMAGFAEWAAVVMAATLLVRERARAWEDADAEAYGASGDRDRADRFLDTTASNTRVHLAGRGKNANKEEPYIQIFPDGVTWYTTSPQGEQVSRYTLFKERLETFLPENDPARASAAEIGEGVNQYKAGVDVLDKAEHKLALEAQRLEAVEVAFDKTINKVFGELAAHFESRAVAEGYFPG